jgi:4-diphosphocytidyl-2-C-methyl-D-erythritol kinase
VKIRTPAKINLRLRLVGKRKDGYHLLDTIMVPVSLYDELEITKAKGDKRARSSSRNLSVTCDDPSVPQGGKNLVYQAASLLMQKSGIDTRVRIHIRKRIPVGAGLGGGSSDAAATLVGLNRLLGLKLSTKALEKLALSLGADVPFFIQARPVRARGIGDRLSVLKKLPHLWAIILYPKFPVSTAWVYRKLRGKLTKPSANTSINSLLGSAEGVRKLLVNDLETVTMPRFPQIKVLKSRLIQEGAIGALMSGSGSSVFGIFNSRVKAERAFQRLSKTNGAEAFLARALGRADRPRTR